MTSTHEGRCEGSDGSTEPEREIRRRHDQEAAIEDQYLEEPDKGDRDGHPLDEETEAEPSAPTSPRLNPSPPPQRQLSAEINRRVLNAELAQRVFAGIESGDTTNSECSFDPFTLEPRPAVRHNSAACS